MMNLKERLNFRDRGNYLFWEGKWHTFQEILSLAHGLAEKLMGRRSPVLVIGHKGPHLIASFLACALSGRPFVPIDSSFPTERRKKIMNLCLSEDLICEEPIDLENISIIKPSTVTPKNDGDWSKFWKVNDVAYIIFTSGTTGDPKGVQITREALEDFLDWTAGNFLGFKAQPGTTWINHALFSFDLSVLELWTSLVTDGRMVSLDHRNNANSRANLSDLIKSDAEVWVSTPSFIDLCFIDRKFSSQTAPLLKYFLFCGEVLAVDTVKKIWDRFPDARVWNLYGPTEATCATTGLEITRELLANEGLRLPVGFSKPNTKIVLQDGEIVVVGSNVSIGYINNRELTEEKFFKLDGIRAYKTGDLGELRESNLLYCRGRIDDQIKFHGYRIELGEIESSLRLLPGVITAACFPLVRNGKVIEIIGCFTVGDGQTFEETSAKEFLSKKLPAYMIPTRFQKLESIPLNQNGKIDRKKLMSFFE